MTNLPTPEVASAPVSSLFWRFEQDTSYVYVPVESISLHRGTTKVRLLKASQSHKIGTVLCVATSQLVNETREY